MEIVRVPGKDQQAIEACIDDLRRRLADLAQTGAWGEIVIVVRDGQPKIASLTQKFKTGWVQNGAF